MRIVNEKQLGLVWNWDEQERKALAQKYQANLERLIYAVHERVDAGKGPAPEDLRALAGELQQAGEMLAESMQNCFDAATTIYTMAGSTPAERQERGQFLAQIQAHKGQTVILRQTSVPELEGKQLRLDELRGIKGILRDGDDRWEALVDFLVPVLDDEPPAAAPPTPETKLDPAPPENPSHE